MFLLGISDDRFTAILSATAAVGVAIVGVLGSQLSRTRKAILDQHNTGNEHTSGEYIHMIAQTQEVILAQLHTNTQELTEGMQQMGELRERFEQLSDVVMEHHDMTEPLIAQFITEHEDQKGEQDV